MTIETKSKTAISPWLTKGLTKSPKKPQLHEQVLKTRNSKNKIARKYLIEKFN